MSVRIQSQLTVLYIYMVVLQTSVVFSQGLVPFYVNATAGTTVYGAFDPLNAIADICHRHTLWMHVDVR